MFLHQVFKSVVLDTFLTEEREGFVHRSCRGEEEGRKRGQVLAGALCTRSTYPGGAGIFPGVRKLVERVAGWIQFWHDGYWQDKLSRSYSCSRDREESATRLRKAMADVPLEQVAPFLSDSSQCADIPSFLRCCHLSSGFPGQTESWT